MKVYLRTFGCRANHYDTEAVRTMLETSGHAIVESASDADVAVFNSCAVTSDAEAELRKVVRRAARERPELRSVVMGCAAALDDDRPIALKMRSLPSVQHVIGGADLPAIAAALDLAPASPLRTHVQTSTRALLRIQDGCDEHCTFCATTMARGANRSRSGDEIVREAAALSERHPEIVITGIHIGTYGADIESSLGAVMTRLVRELPSVRFRLSSIEATELDDALVELLVGAPDHLAPHVHAPLQSGSDRVLKRMGRNWYTSATYCDAIERLAARMDVVGLGADVISGFPGETDDDHAATVALVERLPFTYLHVFPFSPRPGTAAERLSSHVAPVTARVRAAELREIAARKAAAYAASRDGSVADVIVIGAGPAREGMTGDYLTVMPTDPTLPRGARFRGRLELDGEQLRARPVP
ncbi:MAG TPA: MiaB/RimO family radical SAM methylthiotransferase [Gemmatimonadaceae bacterium]|nr:MiaB/RimO family radical SAM methylthiotransferase [Gemmatimonadaceae bacterium]